MAETISNFDFSFINQYFCDLDRQGPGSVEETVRALGFLPKLESGAHIADLGCGTGGQTIALAQHTQASITAIDLYPGSIEKLNATAQRLGLNERVKGVVGSMDQLPFQKNSLDVVWSEGAIYHMGYQKGLEYVRDFLKTGGYVAVTCSTWFTDERPAEIEQWWMEADPEMNTMSHNIAVLQSAGYAPIAAFALPESCWTDNYYNPQEARQEAFLKEHAGNQAAEDFIALMRREAELYDKYKQYFGYVFYIGQKR